MTRSPLAQFYVLSTPAVTAATAQMGRAIDITAGALPGSTGALAVGPGSPAKTIDTHTVPLGLSLVRTDRLTAAHWAISPAVAECLIGRPQATGASPVRTALRGTA